MDNVVNGQTSNVFGVRSSPYYHLVNNSINHLFITRSKWIKLQYLEWDYQWTKAELSRVIALWLPAFAVVCLVTTLTFTMLYTLERISNGPPSFIILGKVTLEVFVCMKKLERVLSGLFLPYLMFFIIDNQRGILSYHIRQLPCLARGARVHMLFCSAAWTILYIETFFSFYVNR